jgi:hypothetical protein
MTERIHEATAPKPTYNWPVILFLIGQTGAAIWFGSWLNTSVVNLSVQIQRIEMARDRAHEARDREFQRLDDKVETQRLLIDAMRLQEQKLLDELDNGWRPADRPRR